MKMKKKNITRKRLSGKYDNRKTRKQHKKYKNKTLKKMNHIVIAGDGKIYRSRFTNQPNIFRTNVAFLSDCPSHDKNCVPISKVPGKTVEGVGNILYYTGYYTGKTASDITGYGFNKIGEGFSYVTGNQPSPPLNAQNLQENQGQFQKSSRSPSSISNQSRQSTSSNFSTSSMPKRYGISDDIKSVAANQNFFINNNKNRTRRIY